MCRIHESLHFKNSAKKFLNLIFWKIQNFESCKKQKKLSWYMNKIKLKINKFLFLSLEQICFKTLNEFALLPQYNEFALLIEWIRLNFKNFNLLFNKLFQLSLRLMIAIYNFFNRRHFYVLPVWHFNLSNLLNFNF